jgi:hypothetical protein
LGYLHSTVQNKLFEVPVKELTFLLNLIKFRTTGN